MTDVEVIVDLVTEPVSLPEAKRWLRIDPDFNLDDTFITGLISDARVSLEKYTGLSFGEKTLKQYSEKCRVEILHGPVTSIESITGISGKEINIDFHAIRFPILSVGEPVFITYKAGYPEGKLPTPLKDAILMQVATDYENREDYVLSNNNASVGVIELSNASKRKADPFRRNLFL